MEKFVKAKMAEAAVNFEKSEELSEFDSEEFTVLPAFCDVHVHLREPGFSYKETVLTGTRAAARGGFTSVCAMPNLKPVPDSLEHLKEELDLIKRDAGVSVFPYGAVTKGQLGQELAEMEEISEFVIAFSDDGHGVQSDELMEEAMSRAKRLGKIIAAHCEVNSLLNGGYIHEGEYAKAHGHKGISSESEWKQIERDIALAKKTGCSYHVCHVSTKEGVELIREGKKAGADVTGEVTPHHLLLDESFLREDGRFKMNPPLRSKRDREALIEGVLDGTLEIIATDHAPHSAKEKALGLEKSAMGITGLETAFPLLYTALVRENILSLKKLTELMSVNPRRRFGIKNDTDLTVWKLDEEYEIRSGEFLSGGKATPFEGRKVFGRCKATVHGNTIAYKEGDTE